MPEPAVTPVDLDIDLRVPAQRRELAGGPWPVLAAVSAGGILGSLARYGLSVALPHPPGGFAWSTFTVNVSGCLLIGVLMVLISQVWTGRRLLRPFLGVGVLGGYTTFSTYIVDIQHAITAGAARTGLLYLAATAASALVAVWASAALTEWAIRPRHRHTDQHMSPEPRDGKNRLDGKEGEDP